MHTSRLAAAAATVVALATGLAWAGPADGAGAQSLEPARAVVGNFVGDEREETFVYRAGSPSDHLVTFGRDASGNLSTTSSPFRVEGFYLPVAGNFDGDPYDEILWHGHADSIWSFTSPTQVTSTPVTVSGGYNPVAGDFDGDGIGDVVWYAAGPASDYRWTFAADGSHSSQRLTINGLFLPVVGSFSTDGADDILWYGEGPMDDFLWDWTPAGTFLSRRLQIVEGYRPFGVDMWGDGVGGSDAFFYAVGTAPDPWWDFLDGVQVRTVLDPVNGVYFPVVAGDLVGDGADDVLWFGGLEGHGPVNVWEHTVAGGTELRRTRYTLPAEFWTGSATVAPAGPPTPVAFR